MIYPQLENVDINSKIIRLIKKIRDMDPDDRPKYVTNPEEVLEDLLKISETGRIENDRQNTSHQIATSVYNNYLANETVAK